MIYIKWRWCICFCWVGEGCWDVGSWGGVCFAGERGGGGGRGKWSLIKLHIISDKHGGFNDFR